MSARTDVKFGRSMYLPGGYVFEVEAKYAAWLDILQTYIDAGAGALGTDKRTGPTPDDAQFLGDSMAVEPRYIGGVIEAALDAGLEIT